MSIAAAPLVESQRSETMPRLSAMKRAAAALGSLGGRANTTAQNAARAQNAKHAGRPGRYCAFCGEPVLGGHVQRSLDDKCGRHGWRWVRKAEAKQNLCDRHLLRDVLELLDGRPSVADLANLKARVQAALDADEC